MQRLFIRVLILCICMSCTKPSRTYTATHIIPKNLPKVAPDFVLVSNEERNKSRKSDSSDTAPAQKVTLPGFYMSKHEITNKEYCYFLNEDSIRKNTALLKTIIDLNNISGRIRIKDSLYAPISGYADYPVVLVSWWGAIKYCEWLTAGVNKKRKEKGEMPLPHYRLPSEYEWIWATAKEPQLSYFIETMCDSAGLQNEFFLIRAHDVKKDTVNMYDATGMNENVYEWTDDNFEPIETIMDLNMVAWYYDTITAEAVVRKHGLIYNRQEINSCGRVARKRAGFYSDTGFRIIQTYLDPASAADF
jgi:formylglycine-generating enzyme